MANKRSKLLIPSTKAHPQADILYDVEKQQQLYRDYNRTLVDAGEIKSRKQLKAMDFIDARPLFQTKTDDMTLPALPGDENVNNFVKTYGWYACIPCFEEGCIQIESQQYIYYKLKNIQIDEKQMEAKIQLYQYTENFGWDILTYGTADFAFNEVTKEKGDVQVYCNAANIMKLRTKYSPKQLHWTDREYLCYLAAFKHQKDKITNMHAELLETTTEIFLKVIADVNYLLSIEKPKLKSRGKTTGKPKSKTITAETSAPPQKQKRVRILGGIAIQSEKPPKQTTHQSVIHYSTATWKVRGHMRTYKNGKTVWIKETVRNRACMKDADPTIPQTVIKIRTPKKEE